jgi:hypothetical protein
MVCLLKGVLVLMYIWKRGCISYGVAEPNSRDSGRQEMFWRMHIFPLIRQVPYVSPSSASPNLPGVCAGVPGTWVRTSCARACLLFAFSCLTGTEQKEGGSSEISYNPTNRLANPHVFPNSEGCWLGSVFVPQPTFSSASSDLRNRLAVGNAGEMLMKLRCL